MAIHSRIQLDPTAQVTVRPGADGTVDVVALDPHGDASTVVSMSPAQFATLRQTADSQARHDG